MTEKANRESAGGAAPARFSPQALRKVLGCMGEYRGGMALVAVCILLSAIASAASSLFLQTLIDDHILPLLAMDTPVFTGLVRALITIGCVYLAGALSALIYNRVMATIAQALPQLISSAFTIAVVFVCMLYVSIPLTLLASAAVFVMMKVAGGVMERSGACFVRQQEALAELNGYVEEMVHGQKVVKVFCREDRTREELAAKNRAWEEAAGAGGSANAIMPMMNALGYVQYVLVAVLGAWMAIAGVGSLGLTGTGTLTLGSIASFLTLTRSFTSPIAQISNQFNSVVTALAGAERIFTFLEEEPERDEGYVTLVSAKIDENGAVTECAGRTGQWAWRHPQPLLRRGGR